MRMKTPAQIDREKEACSEGEEALISKDMSEECKEPHKVEARRLV